MLPTSPHPITSVPPSDEQLLKSAWEGPTAFVLPAFQVYNSGAQKLADNIAAKGKAELVS